MNASTKASGAKDSSPYKTTPASGNSVIPGPRSCFWARGPYSGDPYINVAYPDQNTFYWAATFTMPEGSQLMFEGEFPRSRYIWVLWGVSTTDLIVDAAAMSGAFAVCKHYGMPACKPTAAVAKPLRAVAPAFDNVRNRCSTTMLPDTHVPAVQCWVAICCC
jgi:hypothetical protein